MEEEHVFDPHESALYEAVRRVLDPDCNFKQERLTPAATIANTPLIAREAMYDGSVCDTAFQMLIPSAMV